MSQAGLSRAEVVNGQILASLAAAGFSLKAIFVKLAYATQAVDAISLLTIRMLLAVPAFLLLAHASRGNGARLTTSQWRWIVALGLVGYYCSSLFDFVGLQYISAGLERLILFTYPTLVLLIESFMQRKRISGIVRAAMLLTYFGLVMAFGHDLHHQGDQTAVLIGAGWVFLSSLCYASYMLGTGTLVKQIGSTRLAGYTGTLASLLVIGQFAVTRDAAILWHLPPAVWGWGAAMALFSTVLPIWLAAKAVERLGASHTAAIGTLGPAITILLGWVILNEPFSWAQVAGMVCVISGVVWLGKAKQAASAKPAVPPVSAALEEP